MPGFWQPVTNLRDYTSQNPPGATFFLCLLTLSVSFIGLSSYSYTHTLPNPDTVKDWNHLLSTLSQFQLCLKANASSSEVVSSAPTALPEQDDKGKASVNSENASSVAHLHLKVPLTVTPISPSASLQDFGLHTTMTASQLHLGGNETVNLTLEFVTGNSSHTCLRIRAPAHLLPMSLLPPECPTSDKNILSVPVDATNQPPAASQTCSNLNFRNDPSLTVMLTQEERGVAVRHLMEVGACLVGICLILCLSTGLTQSLTRRYHWNGLEQQNEPLIDS